MVVGIFGKKTYEKERWTAYLEKVLEGEAVDLLDLEVPEGTSCDKAVLFTTGRQDELDFEAATVLDVPRQWVFYPLVRDCKINERYLKFKLQELIQEDDSIVAARLDEGDAAVMLENLYDGMLTPGQLSRQLVKAVKSQADWILEGSDSIFKRKTGLFGRKGAGL